MTLQIRHAQLAQEITVGKYRGLLYVCMMHLLYELYRSLRVGDVRVLSPGLHEGGTSSHTGVVPDACIRSAMPARCGDPWLLRTR